MKGSTQLLVLGTITLFSFIFHLGAFDADLMEARNFIAAKEMLQDGNWLIPTMNGELRLEKPPLPTWLTAISASILGPDSLFALRLPAAIMACLLVLFVFLFQRERQEEAYLPWLTAAVFATSMLVVTVGRNGSWDIFTHSFMMGGIWLLIRAFRSNALNTYLLAGLFLGLSILSKGPVSLYALLIPFLVAWYWTNGGELARTWKGLVSFLLLGLVVGGSWYLYVNLEAAEAIAAMADKETSSWGNRHVRPFWFYWIFIGYTGLWTLFLVASLNPKWSKQLMPAKEYRFLMIWLLTSLILLSIIPTKKERYMLPLMIPGSMLVGQFILGLARAELRSWKLRLVQAHAYLLLTVLVAIPIAFAFLVNAGTGKWISLVMIILAVLFAARWLIRSLPDRNVMSLVGITLFASCLMMAFGYPFLPELQQNNLDYRSLQEVRSDDRIKDLNLYSLGEMNMMRVFDVGQVVRVWDFERYKALPQELPFVVFSHYPPFQLIDRGHADSVAITELDVFAADPRSNRWVWRVSLVESK
jgi:4-amino-4-deoxy-L-arabinose transferase-like glycosyltransferase